MAESKKLSQESIHFVENFALPTNGRWTQRVKFFCENRICRVLPAEEAYGIIGGIVPVEGTTRFRCPPQDSPFLDPPDHMKLFLKAVRKLKDGDSWETFLHICSQVREDNRKPAAPKGLDVDRFIGHIDLPKFHRADSGSDPVFTGVMVSVGLTGIYPDPKATLAALLPQIKERVVQKVICDRTWRFYHLECCELHLQSIRYSPGLSMATFEYSIKKP